MSIHSSYHTTVPGEFCVLTFADKQHIDVASSHMYLIHLKNVTLGARGHCVEVEQEIPTLFRILSIDPKYIIILNVRRSGRSSDQEVYEKIPKVLRKQNILADLCWLMEHKVLSHTTL
jgi:hypothetical protein